MPRITSIKVSLSLPFGLGGVEGTWEPDEAERNAAWELYVELVTRIATAELRPGEGLLREALSSNYSLFDTTRSILRKYGPSVARPKAETDHPMSLGYLAVVILNGALRPLLSRWHPLLLDYESLKEPADSPVDHERRWEHSEELRASLNTIRGVLIEYANLLAQVADVPSLLVSSTTNKG